MVPTHKSHQGEGFSDLGQWTKFSQNLRPVLTKTATRRAVVAMQHTKTDDGWRGHIDLPSRAVEQLRNQLNAQGVLLALFKNGSTRLMCDLNP